MNFDRLNWESASNKKVIQLDLGVSVSTCARDQVRIGYAGLGGLHKG